MKMHRKYNLNSITRRICDLDLHRKRDHIGGLSMPNHSFETYVTKLVLDFIEAEFMELRQLYCNVMQRRYYKTIEQGK